MAIKGHGNQQYVDKIRGLIEDYKITSRVIWVDKDDDVAAVYSGIDVFCLASHYGEGFSNAVLEYMAAGLPVVATDAGGNKEAVEDGVTGHIICEREPGAFAAPIIELLKDDTKREQMGRRSLERCRKMFDIDAAVRRHEDYYASLVEEANR